MEEHDSKVLVACGNFLAVLEARGIECDDLSKSLHTFIKHVALNQNSGYVVLDDELLNISKRYIKRYPGMWEASPGIAQVAKDYMEGLL